MCMGAEKGGQEHPSGSLGEGALERMAGARGQAAGGRGRGSGGRRGSRGKDRMTTNEAGVGSEAGDCGVMPGNGRENGAKDQERAWKGGAAGSTCAGHRAMARQGRQQGRRSQECAKGATAEAEAEGDTSASVFVRPAACDRTTGEAEQRVWDDGSLLQNANTHI